MRYAVFDVETPNAKNDRMSSVSVCVVDGGMIAEKFYSLVNPETYFNEFNSNLTGIRAVDVADAPTFPEIWRRLASMFEGCVLVAHNAPFDMSVLSKCLRAYGISWKPSARYLCTCRMARRALPTLPSKSLDSVCRHFGIPLLHHNAESDTLAAAEILLTFFGMGIDPDEFIKEYVFE